MIILSPDTVRLGALALDNVQFVAVDRHASRLAVEFSDLGPHAAFADVPESRVTVRLARRVTRSESLDLKPGDKLALTVRAAPGLSAAGVRVISAEVVITEITWTAETRAGSAGALQRITALAVSSDGAADPVSVTSANSEV